MATRNGGGLIWPSTEPGGGGREGEPNSDSNADAMASDPSRWDNEEVNARFAELVGGLANSDVERLAATAPREPSTRFPPRATSTRRPGPRDWPTSPEVEALEEAQTRFVPPDPGRQVHLGAGRSPLTVAAWIGAVGAPLLGVVALVARAIMRVNFPQALGLVGLGVFVASLAVLVARMPNARDHDDDGAVL